MIHTTDHSDDTGRWPNTTRLSRLYSTCPAHFGIYMFWSKAYPNEVTGDALENREPTEEF